MVFGKSIADGVRSAILNIEDDVRINLIQFTKSNHKALYATGRINIINDSDALRSFFVDVLVYKATNEILKLYEQLSVTAP